MLYLLFRSPRNDSEKKSDSASNGRIPENYVRRTLQMDPDELEKIQKETWKAQREKLRQQTAVKQPVRKLGRRDKQFVRFHFYGMPISLLVSWFTLSWILSVAPNEQSKFMIAIFYIILFLAFTPLFGGGMFLIYSMIFQPWVFTKVPENKLPPLNDTNDKTQH